MSTVDDNDLLVTETWARVVEAIDRLVERGDTPGEWRVPAGSALRGDDRRSSPYQTSHAVQALLAAGIDSLNGIRHLVFGRPDEVGPPRPVLHQAAHFVLARGAIENLATALWIIGPASRSERVIRTLRWHVQNVNDQHSALDRFGKDIASVRTKADKLIDLKAIASAVVGEVPSGFTEGYRPTTVVRYVDTLTPADELKLGLSTHFIWQLCSGFAHGRPWAHLGMLDREEFPTEDPGVVHARMTSDLGRALMAPHHAVRLCESLLRRHAELARPLHD